jgi:preprotein translocase subunit YajC
MTPLSKDELWAALADNNRQIKQTAARIMGRITYKELDEALDRVVELRKARKELEAKLAMEQLQVGDLVRTNTGITGRIVTMSQDGQYAYIPVTAEVGATVLGFDVAALERIEPNPADK